MKCDGGIIGLSSSILRLVILLWPKYPPHICLFRGSMSTESEQYSSYFLKYFFAPPVPWEKYRVFVLDSFTSVRLRRSTYCGFVVKCRPWVDYAVGGRSGWRRLFTFCQWRKLLRLTQFILQRSRTIQSCVTRLSFCKTTYEERVWRVGLALGNINRRCLIVWDHHLFQLEQQLGRETVQQNLDWSAWRCVRYPICSDCCQKNVSQSSLMNVP